MAKTIEQELMYCSNCEKTTVCMRNGKKINWLMQVILVVFTGGLWGVVIIFWALFKGATSPLPGTGAKTAWICSICGQDAKGAKTKETAKEEGNDALLGYLVILGIVIVLAFVLS